MSKHKPSGNLDYLNRVVSSNTRAFHELDCKIFYYLDEVEEMLENGDKIEDVLECIDHARKRLTGKVLDGGALNWRTFNLVKEFIPGLEEPPIDEIKADLEAEYNGKAGVK